jgi:hypothetical protein
MGKAAENERIKLRATWFNNISVGVTLTTFLIPVLSLGAFNNWVHRMLFGGPLSSHEGAHLFSLVCGFGVGVFFAYLSRKTADDLIATIQD